MKKHAEISKTKAIGILLKGRGDLVRQLTHQGCDPDAHAVMAVNFLLDRAQRDEGVLRFGPRLAF